MLLLQLFTDTPEASRGLSARAEPLVIVGLCIYFSGQKNLSFRN